MAVSQKALAIVAAAVVGLGAVAVAGVAVGHGGIGIGIGIGPRDCVDSNGANSTPDELFGAVTNAPAHRSIDGEAISLLESSRLLEGTEMAEWGRMIRSTYVQSPDEFDVVPPFGGDAAFARAVCERDGMWAPEGLTADQIDVLAATPHYLRSLGRQVCESIQLADIGAEAYLASDQRELRDARADPEAARRKAIREAEEELAIQEAMLSVVTTAEERRAVESAVSDHRVNIDALRKLPPENVIARVSDRVGFQLAAVEHLCPGESEVGFGPECGPITYPNAGGRSGVVRLFWDDEMSCEEGVAVLNNHFAETLNTDTIERLPAGSPLASFHCETFSTSALVDGHHTLTSCSTGSSDRPDGVVIVPRDE